MSLADTMIQGPGNCERCEQHNEKCLMTEDKATGKLHVYDRACYLTTKKENPNLQTAKI